MTYPSITIEDFRKLDIKIGRIIKAEKLPKSEKLLKLTVDLGSETRQIIAGLGSTYQPEELAQKLVPVLVNLAPRSLMGEVSQGMILAASNGELPVLISPISEIEPGSIIR